MKYFFAAAGFAALAGCSAIQTIAPRTAAGFAANGVLGALDGASGAIIARCETIDGTAFRVAIDEVATETDQTEALDAVRESRRRICRIAANAKTIGALGAAGSSDWMETGPI